MPAQIVGNSRQAFLSSEYVIGRRASYTPPLRLFLVLSIGFFLLLSVINSIGALRETLGGGVDNSGLELQIAQSDSDSEIAAAENFDGLDEEELGEILTIVTNIRFPLLADSTNERLQTALRSQMETNYQAVRADPEEFFSSSLDYITLFMLLLMPILAFIQSILYFTSRRYYVEHFVLTLHNQTFLILSFGLTVVMDFIEDLELPVVSATFSFLSSILALWITVYLFLSLKYFFGQGYAITTIKLLFAGFVYGICILMAMFIGLILLFVLS